MSTIRGVRSFVGLVALWAVVATGTANAEDGTKGRWCPRYRNPVVYNSGRYVTGHQYNPWTEQYRVQTHRTRVHASAFDPYRGYADRGSTYYVDRYVADGSGQYVRERGWHWTSYGIPHQDTMRDYVYRTSPRSSRHDSTRIIKDVGSDR